MAAPGLEHFYSPCLVQLAVFNQNQMLLHQLQIMQVLYINIQELRNLQKNVILFQEKALQVSRIIPLLAPFRDGQTQLTAIMALF